MMINRKLKEMATLRDIAINLSTEEGTQKDTSDKALFVFGTSNSVNNAAFNRYVEFVPLTKVFLECLTGEINVSGKVAG